MYQHQADSSAEGAKIKKKNRILKFLASLKLAVIVIISIGVLTAWGTLVEADYDATAAQKLVYHSPYMYAILLLLATNLIAVMVDRWPWKQRHIGFLLAHVGIIILLIGSVVTRYFGIDGSLTFGIGESSRSVVVPETDLVVYASMDGEKYTKLYDTSQTRPVDFFLNSPKKKPVEIELPDGTIRVTDYEPYTLRDQKIVESERKDDGAAVRFQLQNANVNMTDWILQPGRLRESSKDLGPAQIILAPKEYETQPSGNSIVLRPQGDDVLEYAIYTQRDPASVRRGVVKAGETIETGWMGLVMRVLKYMPSAREEVKYLPVSRPTPLTTAALKVEFAGQEQWVALNSLVKFFTDSAVYIMTYANRRIDIGFEMFLKDFRIGRYQGTMRAAAYESVVAVPGLGDVVISMNEPLYHNGYTFYQASFQEDETGKPVASVLSVNWDPGRELKYLGSLMIVLGSIHMFWFKRRSRKEGLADAA